jgi:hypothetical protein
VTDTISIIISVALSELISDTMKKAYVECLQRYLDSGQIHTDELSLIKQEIKQKSIPIQEFSKKDAIEFIQKYGSKNYTKNIFEHKKSNKKQDIKETRIKDKKDIIDDLREKGKKAVASRDKWRNRAEIAESRVNELENKLLSKNSNTDAKFKKIKNKFSMMYHPDRISGSNFEKLVKQELFKEFWQEIEKIEDE